LSLGLSLLTYVVVAVMERVAVRTQRA